jgi:hypothetical protein
LDQLNRNYPLDASTNFQVQPTTSSDPTTPARDIQTGPVTAFDYQGSGQFIEQSIQCIEPNEGVSFEVNPTNFPVYILNSKFNTDSNYDYGVFSDLETRLKNANLGISTFMVNFVRENVYVFGDHSAPATPMTIVLVTQEKATRCEGQTQWPLTTDNMLKLGISKRPVELKHYEPWIDGIPIFFCCLAFVAVGIQFMVESRIEARELERRMRLEAKTAQMRKYFKKKQDKFDKIDYLGDMYKLIQQLVADIKAEIAKNQRLTEEQDRDNMNKMLKNKYSVIEDLKKYAADKDLDEIKRKVKSMLTNLRFNDGRSLNDVVDSMKMKKQAEEAEAQLKEFEESQKNDKLLDKEDSLELLNSHRLSSSSDDELSHDSFFSSEKKDSDSKDGDADKDNDETA